MLVQKRSQMQDWVSDAGLGVRCRAGCQMQGWLLFATHSVHGELTMCCQAEQEAIELKAALSVEISRRIDREHNIDLQH